MRINSGKHQWIISCPLYFYLCVSRQTDKYLFNALQPSIDGLLKNDLTKQEPTFVADAIKLFLQLHQIRERAAINHLMQTAPPSALEAAANIDLPDPANDPNTTNLDLTIHAHLNSSIVSNNKQVLDKETMDKQKHEVRLLLSLQRNEMITTVALRLD